MPEGADSGGHEGQELDDHEWLLRCQGWRVYGPDGEYVGVVTEVIYDFSSRWDRPQLLKIRDERGRVEQVRIEEIATVDPARESLRLLQASAR